ncbi:MAG TPA: hypothetical protein PLZ51_26080, partial [Aggregatilineales bacterium]|nr:hypothetical protein [Aggregatilineales bacterium]
SAQVLKNIVRARIYGSFANQVATSVGGTSITFTGELEVGRIDTNSQNFYNNLISFKPDVTIEPPISEELLDYVIENQEELNDIPLD